MITQKLAGKNVHTYTTELGLPIEGDGTTLLEKGIYLARAVAEDTGLPEGQEPGKVFESDGTIQPETGDSVNKFTLNDRCDFSSLTIELSFTEIDSTTQCDDVTSYEKGLVNATITAPGVLTAGLSEDLIAKFLPIAQQSEDFKSIENIEVDDDPMYFYAELTHKVTKKGVPKLAIIFPGKIFSISLGGEKDGMQPFTANIRIVSDDNLKPHVFKLLKV